MANEQPLSTTDFFAALQKKQLQIEDTKTPTLPVDYFIKARLNLELFFFCFYQFLLGGGFKYLLFHPLFGEDSHFDQYVSKRVKPPTSLGFFLGGVVFFNQLMVFELLLWGPGGLDS